MKQSILYDFLKTKTIEHQITSQSLMTIYSNWLFQSNELDVELTSLFGTWFFNKPFNLQLRSPKKRYSCKSARLKIDENFQI